MAADCSWWRQRFELLCSIVRSGRVCSLTFRTSWELFLHVECMENMVACKSFGLLILNGPVSPRHLPLWAETPQNSAPSETDRSISRLTWSSRLQTTNPNLASHWWEKMTWRKWKRKKVCVGLFFLTFTSGTFTSETRWILCMRPSFLSKANRTEFTRVYAGWRWGGWWGRSG